MNLIRFVNLNRLITLCLTSLMMFSLIRGNPTILCAQQDEDYNALTVFLNNVKSVRYHFLDNEGIEWWLGFKTIGEDTVSGEATWKVEWTYTEKDEKSQIVILWISKSTGKCLKAEIEGVTYTGEMVEMLTYALFIVWFWIGTWQESWEPLTVYDYWEAGYGRLIFRGSEMKTFGPTSLLIYKYRWEGFINAPEGFRGAVEWWFAPVIFGTLLVHLRAESGGKWWQLELLSIELVNPQPRPNIVIDARVDKTQLTPNEEATFSITVSNTGNAIGTHNLTLTVNGEVKKSWLILLNQGESKSFSHKLSFSTEGSYSVRIGDQTFTITVSTIPPARFEISNLNVNPSSIKVGQSSTISITVRNSGGRSGTYEVKLRINNQAVETRQVTLGPGQSTTVSFSFTPTSEGIYNIEVNGLTGNLTVIKEIVPEIPWLLILGIIAIVIVIVLVVLLLRRKPKPAYAVPPPPPP
ncbi:MAG: CARDB domain-containing protein [Nitrososphaerota archaeon]|nr:CARDB domain-containing protein [Nitrososphaerota archaeon]